MSWLEGLAQPDWRKFHSDTEVQVIAESAIALLNEQDTLLKEYRNTIKCCISPDWFCADGERKGR